MKKISIIIPCYNVEKYLGRCFESLQNQTIGMQNMELIFVDDCSTDNTLSILQSFEEQYPDDVILIPFAENQGQSVARNVALEYATAPYVGYVDSDDVVEVDMFEKMTQAIEKYNCDYVQCRWDRIEGEVISMTRPFERAGYYNMSDADERQKYLAKSLRVISVWDKIYRREFLIKNNISCPVGVIREDIAFCYQVYMCSASMYCMNDILYHYCINPNGTMKTSKPDYEQDVLNVCLFFWERCTEQAVCMDRKEDMDWLFLEMGYVYILWELCDDSLGRSYEYFLLVRDVIKQLNIDYHNNSYRILEGNEFDNLMLKLLDVNLSRQEFMNVIEHMRKQINMTDIEG